MPTILGGVVTDPVLITLIGAAVALLFAAIILGIGSVATRRTNSADKPTRKQSHSLAHWLRTWWLEVPEPREISTIYTIVYLAFSGVGAITIIAPPAAVTHIATPGVIIAVGAFFIVGALTAGLGGAWENWRVERIGLALMAAALAGFAVLTLALEDTTIGTRIAVLILILIALAVLVLRWVLIRGYTYRPRG